MRDSTRVHPEVTPSRPWHKQKKTTTTTWAGMSSQTKDALLELICTADVKDLDGYMWRKRRNITAFSEHIHYTAFWEKTNATLGELHNLLQCKYYGPHCIADLVSAVFHTRCKSSLQYVIVFHVLYIIIVLCISVLKNENMWERSLAPAGEKNARWIKSNDQDHLQELIYAAISEKEGSYFW